MSTYENEKSQRPSPSDWSTSEEDGVGAQIAAEKDHAIQYRTCSWQKTAALLFCEYICLAITSFPWSFSVLGLGPGVVVTLATAATVQYTSLILWRFCLKHPEVRDVCDVALILFNGSKIAYNATAIMFVLNNVFIQALHCLVGAKLLNTLTNSAACTVAFSAVSAVICFIFSLPRPLHQLSWLSIFSAVTMFIAVMLLIIFSGIQDHAFGYIPGEEPIVTSKPISGTTFVAGMSAFLNILYTFVGQITLPSFIAEMKEPKDFPKALWAITIAEAIVFTLCGALVYHFVGNQYITAPAFGSLSPTYKKIAFSFAIPTIVMLGSLYASVTARFVFFRLFSNNSKHRHSNTLLGWGTWVGILAISWIIAFVIASVVPFFSDLLSLMSSLFDGWFGFIFWGMAYLTLYPGKARWAGAGRSAETLLNYAFIIFGFYVLVAGTYTSIKSIIIDYTGQKPFSCASNAL